MSVKITWLGHSCFALEADGHRLLIDPYLNDNPAAPIKADKAEADFILLTHGHFDHVADAPAIAKRTGATVLAGYEVSGVAQTRRGR